MHSIFIHIIFSILFVSKWSLLQNTLPPYTHNNKNKSACATKAGWFVLNILLTYSTYIYIYICIYIYIYVSYYIIYHILLIDCLLNSHAQGMGRGMPMTWAKTWTKYRPNIDQISTKYQPKMIKTDLFSKGHVEFLKNVPREKGISGIWDYRSI